MDLISAEYGWSDDSVLDLPIRRVRQIIANIQFRRESDFRRDGKLVEWQTRIVASFMVSTARTDKSHGKKLQNLLKKIRFRTSAQEEADSEGDEGSTHGRSAAAKPPAAMSEEELERLITEGDTSAADRNKPEAFDALTRGRVGV